MSKSPFESLTVRELRSEARKAGLAGYSTLTKLELVALLQKKGSKPQLSQNSVKAKASEIVSQPAKAATANRKPGSKKNASLPRILAPKRRDEDSVPARDLLAAAVPAPPPRQPQPTFEPFDEHVGASYSYGRNRCTLMLKSPELYFVYWDFDASLERNILGAGGRPALRFMRNGVRDKSLVDIMLLDRHQYVHIPGQEGEIKVELGGIFGTEFVAFLSSNTVIAMRNQPSFEDAVEFVVPEWLDTDCSLPHKPMTRLEWEHLYGPVPVDVPWYKARKPKGK